MWEHKNRCLEQKLCARRFLVLSIDNRTYLCQFGCHNIRYTKLLSIYEHYYTSHTRSELKKWGINRDRLAEGLEDECSRDNMPASYFAKTEELVDDGAQAYQKTKKRRYHRKGSTVKKEKHPPQP